MAAGRVKGIYTLSCPESGTVRYVGKSVDIHGRYKRHCRNREAMKNGARYGNWIRSLKSNPILDVVYIGEDLDNQEKLTIQKFRELGCDLVNTSDGGEGFPENPVYALSRLMRARFGTQSNVYKYSRQLIEVFCNSSDEERSMIERKCSYLMESKGG